MPITESTFRELALEDPEGHWEMYCGHVRRKPGMTAEHNDAMNLLALQLGRQLDPEVYRVRTNSGHVRRSAESYFIPDVYVVPTQQVRRQRGTRALETFNDMGLSMTE